MNEVRLEWNEWNAWLFGPFPSRGGTEKSRLISPSSPFSQVYTYIFGSICAYIFSVYSSCFAYELYALHMFGSGQNWSPGIETNLFHRSF